MKAVWKHQRFLRSVLIGSVGCVAGGVLWVLLSDDVSSEAPLPEEKPVKVDTSLPASSQEMFYRKMEHQNGLLKERLEAQEKILETLMKIQSEGAPSPDEALRTRIADLEKRLGAEGGRGSSGRLALVGGQA